MRKVRNILAFVAAVVAITASQAHAAIDLTAVETNCTALGTAVVASAAIVIPAAIGARAVKAGGLWVVRLFQRMMG